MPNLTTKELSALEDQLNYEKLMIKKYKAFQTSAAIRSLRASASNCTAASAAL
jgi:hypothetical protein